MTAIEFGAAVFEAIAIFLVLAVTYRLTTKRWPWNDPP